LIQFFTLEPVLLGEVDRDIKFGVGLEHVASDGRFRVENKIPNLPSIGWDEIPDVVVLAVDDVTVLRVLKPCT
jgi:hypothetical protein